MTDTPLETPDPRPTNPKALVCLVFGILTLAAIPVLTLLVAPCGFPLSLISGTVALLTARGASREIAQGDQKGAGLVKGGRIAAWLGLGVNFALMLLKLAMFIGLIALPLWAILQGNHPK